MPSGAEPGTTRGRSARRAQTPPRPSGKRRPTQARGAQRAAKLKGARYALWKNPEDLTERQSAQAGLDRQDRHPAATVPTCSKRACGTCSRSRGEEGKDALDRWICWARRCRIPVFVELARRIVTHRDSIHAALDHGLSQGLIESTNTKIRVLTRIAFGFHNPAALIALAMLALGGHRPALPGRG